MEHKVEYEIEFMVKTPFGVAREMVINLKTPDAIHVGEHLIKYLREYGKLSHISISIVPCPVCGKCPVCGR